MDIKNIKTIWKKELRDTIRDRRTLFSTILIPMLLMPLILVGTMKLVQSQSNQQAQQAVKLAVVGAEYAPALNEALSAQDKLEIVTPQGDPKQAVADGTYDAALVIPADFQSLVDGEKPAPLTFISKSTNTAAGNIAAKVATVISEYNDNLLADRFTAKMIDPGIISKVTLVPVDAATQKEVGGFILGFLIPIFIVIWSIVGGQYTAVDVSAGEKERKTLEALLLTPVKRIDIVMGKFLAVSTVALSSIIVAISSFYITFLYASKLGLSMSGSNVDTSSSASILGGGGLSFSVDPQAALLLFGVSVLLVLMFSALILSISIFAKSFKEAESYISPAYLIVILPVVFVNAVPGFQPQLIHFFIPAVNAILLFKEVLLRVYDWSHILITFVSLAVYSLVAVYIASRIYSKESVLFKD